MMDEILRDIIVGMAFGELCRALGVYVEIDDEMAKIVRDVADSCWYEGIKNAEWKRATLACLPSALDNYVTSV